MSYDNREALTSKTILEITEETRKNHYLITIDNEIGRGGSCLVYSGTIENDMGQALFDRPAIIKEFYPKSLSDKGLHRRDDASLDIPDRLMAEYQELKDHFCEGQKKHILYAGKYSGKALAPASYGGIGNGTFYVVSDVGAGDVLSKKGRESYTIIDALKITISICDVIGALHTDEADSKLYLDCKPDNIYVDGNKALLFDFDTAQDLYRYDFCSYSEGWGAPEQRLTEKGYKDILQIGFHTDMFSIGAVLLWLLTGIEGPTDEDLDEIERGFDWKKRITLKDSTGAKSSERFMEYLDSLMRDLLEKDPERRMITYSDERCTFAVIRELNSILREAEEVQVKKGFESTNSHIDEAKKEIIDALKSKTRSEDPINFDTEIERSFEKLFGDKERSKKSDESSFIDTLNRILARSYVKEFTQNNPKSKHISDPCFSEDDFDEYGDCINRVHYYNGKASLNGLHFSIVDNSDRIIVIYRTIMNYDISNFTYFYTAERLESVSETIDREKTKHTYFVDYLLEKETYLSVITFDSKNRIAIVNSGILFAINGVVKLSSSPSVIKFDNMGRTSEKKEIPCEEDSTTIILDPTTGKELPRIKKADPKGIERYYIEIYPHRSYLAFQIRNKDTITNRYPMDEEDIGDYFMKGKKGFAYSVYNALIWYEKAKTSTAFRKMADIFSNDPVFADEELAEKYRKLSEITE